MNQNTYCEVYYDLPCTEEQDRLAHIRLKERLDAGETASEILGIEPKHAYYIDKIVHGLMRMDLRLYYRIFKLPPIGPGYHTAASKMSENE